MAPIARGAIQQNARQVQGRMEEGLSVAAAGIFAGDDRRVVAYVVHQP
jgi:hypothetical protein